MQEASQRVYKNSIQALTTDRERFITLLHDSSQPGSDASKAFINKAFYLHYNARISDYMPNLVSVIDKTKKVKAVVGYRCAGQNELFLEQHLDQPLDYYISNYIGDEVSRSQIVEVGNLACSANGYARLIIIRLTELLFQSGYRWVGFTATPGLLNSFQRLNLTPHSIAPAEIKKLHGTQSDWGTYYDNDPYVMFGSIEWGFNKLKEEQYI